MPGETVQNCSFILALAEKAQHFSFLKHLAQMLLHFHDGKAPRLLQVATFCLIKGSAALVCNLQVPGAHHKMNTCITPTKTLELVGPSHMRGVTHKRRAYLPEVTEYTMESRKAEASTLAIC